MPEVPTISAPPSLRLGKSLLVVLLLSLEGGHGDTVQVTLAGLGDTATALVLVLLEHVDLLEGLHDLAVDGAGGVDVVAWAHTPVLDAAVDLPQAADTDGLAHVDVAGDGGGADVEPVNALRRELLGAASLDGVGPTCRQKPRKSAFDSRNLSGRVPPVPHGIQVSQFSYNVDGIMSHKGSLPVRMSILYVHLFFLFSLISGYRVLTDLGLAACPDASRRQRRR